MQIHRQTNTDNNQQVIQQHKPVSNTGISVNPPIQLKEDKTPMQFFSPYSLGEVQSANPPNEQSTNSSATPPIQLFSANTSVIQLECGVDQSCANDDGQEQLSSRPPERPRRSTPASNSSTGNQSRTNTTSGSNTPHMSYIGWTPEDTEGPYAYAGNTDSSVRVGAGLLSEQLGDGSHIKSMGADAEAGIWGEEGRRRGGVRGDVAMFDGYHNPNGVAGIGMDVFTASAEASIGENGATLGAGATAVGVDGHLGNFDASRNNDTQVRAGVSANVGAAGRLHWGDSDGDGQREYGIGADIGPLSFDIKSEDPLGAFSPIQIPGVNYTNMAGRGLSYLGSAIGGLFD